jgi:IMP dehydrogenase/GMP reductase
MKALTFSDVLIKPKYSEIESRKEVDIGCNFGEFKLDLPVFSANMKSITEHKMAIEMYHNGGMGVLHRFCSVKEAIEEYKIVVEKIYQDLFSNGKLREVGSKTAINYSCAVSIGVQENDRERFKALYEIGARIFVIDIAHGHSKKMKEQIQWIKANYEDVYIIAGNIATAEGARDLAEWGANCLKMGIGPGCFVAGTKVITNNGEKNIEKIKNGDVVLTHRGRYKKVIGTSTRQEENEIISINGNKCTTNHEFYVLNKKYSEIVNDDNINEYAEWIPSGMLTKDYLLIEIEK